MKKVVYITGCLGFIGHHLTRKCLELGWYVIGVDKVTYAANEKVLSEFLSYNTFKFIKSDINDLDSLYDCDYVINTAAESHVDNSITDSQVFIDSNVDGVHHLLKLIKQKQKMPVFLHFSTDEVYGDILKDSHYETDLLKPSNPYSATKACGDMLISAWARTFGVPYVIVRPTNNYGIGQYVEKLIPKSCKYLTLGKKIPVHEQGEPRRTWLCVKDTCSAIIRIIESEKTNEIYNIAGNYEEKNINVIKLIINNFFHEEANYLDYVDFDYSRAGQDVRYSINDDKIKSLGWTPEADFEEEIKEIVKYYKNNFIW